MNPQGSKMSEQSPLFHWASQQLDKDCEVIDCREYDPMKDFNRDPSGCYVLIKVNFATSRIEVAVCNKDHKIVRIFSGRKAQDIYHQIFQHEKKHNVRWFEDKGHAAYLGKELKKAELALVMGNSAYFQE